MKTNNPIKELVINDFTLRYWDCDKCGELRTNKHTHTHGKPLPMPVIITIKKWELEHERKER